MYAYVCCMHMYMFSVYVFVCVSVSVHVYVCVGERYSLLRGELGLSGCRVGRKW